MSRSICVSCAGRLAARTPIPARLLQGKGSEFGCPGGPASLGLPPRLQQLGRGRPCVCLQHGAAARPQRTAGSAAGTREQPGYARRSHGHYSIPHADSVGPGVRPAGVGAGPLAPPRLDARLTKAVDVYGVAQGHQGRPCRTAGGGGEVLQCPHAPQLRLWLRRWPRRTATARSTMGAQQPVPAWRRGPAGHVCASTFSPRADSAPCPPGCAHSLSLRRPSVMGGMSALRVAFAGAQAT